MSFFHAGKYVAKVCFDVHTVSQLFLVSECAKTGQRCKSFSAEMQVAQGLGCFELVTSLEHLKQPKPLGCNSLLRKENWQGFC